MSWSVAGLLVSDFCGAAAALAQATILGKVVYDQTGSEFNLGLLGLAEFAPALLLVLVSGSVADRIDRRRLVAIAALVQAGLALGLGWYVSSRPTSVTPIFLLVVGCGIALAFSAPASRSLPADAVDAAFLPWLIARSSAAFPAGIVAGPVIGGLLFTVDVRSPFVAIAGLLVVMAASMTVVRTAPSPATPTFAVPLEPAPELAPAIFVEAALEIGSQPRTEGFTGGVRDATEGLRFVAGNPVLLGAISLDLLAVLFGGAIALLPAIAKDRLAVGVVGLGWLRAAGGIGAGVMTGALTVRPIRRNVGRMLLTVVAVFGAFTIVLGVTRSFVVAFGAIVVLSAADAVSVFIRATLVPLLTPRAKRGRVLAVENVFIGGSNELGAFESGVTGQVLGTAGAVILGGVATLAVAVGWWLAFPQLRDVDAFPLAVEGEGVTANSIQGAVSYDPSDRGSVEA